MVNLKKILLFLFLLFVLFIFGCENVDLSKVSDEDLERLSEQAIKCEKPYIRFGTSCCLDQNDNKICDRDEKIIEVVEIPSEEVVVSKCTLPAGIACTDFVVAKDGIAVLLRNGMGFNIDEVNVAITGCGTGGIGEDYGTYLPNGAKDTYAVSCDSPLTGSEFTGKIIITYRNTETALTHLVQGTLSSSSIEAGLTIEKFLPEKCILAPGLACVSHKIEPTTATLIISNGLGRTIELDSISVGNCGVDIDDGLITKSGEEKRVDIDGCYYGKSGDKFKDDIEIRYTDTTTGLTHTINGLIETRIE